MTTRDLRRKWKPQKERLAAVDKQHPTNVRFHRAGSWLQRAEGLEDDFDLQLICLWTAFNALYGRWDDRLNEPIGDRECWRQFLDRMLELDDEGRLAGVLTNEKKLVMSLLDDHYLGNYFWRDPDPKKALATTNDRRKAATWYIEQNWAMILERAVERIYTLRCQMIHGAATHNSKQNRTSLKRCTMMMNHLLPAILEVWVGHAADEDWGTMCYPPVG